MEFQPVILKNIIFDLNTRTFHTDESPLYPLLKLDGTPFKFSPPIYPESKEILVIKRPTYAMNHYHTCFGHAYVDTCIPLLSILHEYDSSCLENYGYQLFIFKELWSDINSNPYVVNIFNNWEKRIIDYTNGTFNGAYHLFHRVFSDVPILFEKNPPPQRYILFSTLLYGGNENHQRCIHNCNSRYPGRRNAPPAASDKQILTWIDYGKSAISRYLSLSALVTPIPVLFLSRKETRAFDLISTQKLSDMLDIEPVYFEDIPINQQIEYFRRAEQIIAAHGSGLCHLIWCKPGTHIIEIFASDDPRKPIFESFCKVLGLRYTRIECSDKKIELDDSIHIPPQAFFRIYDAVKGGAMPSQQPSV